MRRRVMRALWGARSFGGKTPPEKVGCYGVSTIAIKKGVNGKRDRKKFLIFCFFLLTHPSSWGYSYSAERRKRT